MLRRFLRHAFTILSALSLLLCVAACVLWVRSYWVAEVVVLPAPNGADFSAYSELGETCVQIQWPKGAVGGESDEPREVLRRRSAADPDSRFNPPKSRERWPGGFLVESGIRDGFVYVGPPLAAPLPEQRYVAVVLPQWFVALWLSILPTVAVVRVIRRRRRARTIRCLACGYDIRAHSGGETCPECGTPVQSAA